MHQQYVPGPRKTLPTVVVGTYSSMMVAADASMYGLSGSLSQYSAK